MSDVKPWTQVNIYNKEEVKRFEQHMVARAMVREVPAHEITLRFRSEQEKSDWLGQLLDGAGEGWCDVHWDWQHGVKCDDAKVFDVELFEEDDDES